MKNKEIKKHLVSKIYLTCQGEANAGDNQKDFLHWNHSKKHKFDCFFVVVLFFQPEEIFNCFFVIYLCLFSNDRSRLLFKSKSVVYNNL